MTNDPSSNAVRKLRLRAFTFLAMALVLGSGAVLLVKTYLDRARATARSAQVASTPVVVAAADLPIATTLTAEHLKVIAWPSESVPKESFHTVAALIGHTTSQGLVAGEALLPGRLIDPARGRGLSALLAPGTRAMAVKVDQVIGVAGFVGAGDFVDVIVTLQPDEETNDQLGQEKIPRISKIILQNIKVLAVGEQLQTDGRKPVKVQVVTLEVLPDQSERLALSAQYGKVNLTMRSRLDSVATATTGVTPFALLTPEDLARLQEASSDGKREPERRPSAAVPRQARRAVASEPGKPSEPAAPVVEILRAGKREERTLLPSADSKPIP